MGNFRLPTGYTLTLGQASLPVMKSWFLVKIEPYTALIKDKRQNVPICNKIVRLFLGYHRHITFAYGVTASTQDAKGLLMTICRKVIRNGYLACYNVMSTGLDRVSVCGDLGVKMSWQNVNSQFLSETVAVKSSLKFYGQCQRQAAGNCR